MYKVVSYQGSSYRFNKDHTTKYKGYHYQKFNDEYLVFEDNGFVKGMRFSVKGCKELINEINVSKN